MTLTSLVEMREIPGSDRVYPDCPHEMTVVILSVCVDNTDIRSYCPCLVMKFHADVHAGVNFTGDLSWLLGATVRYTYVM
jgi:hypothetical protein